MPNIPIDPNLWTGRPGMIMEYNPLKTRVQYAPFIAQCHSCLTRFEADPECEDCCGTMRCPIPDTEVMVSMRHHVRQNRR